MTSPMKPICELPQDKRPITAITYDDGSWTKVGEAGVTTIQGYYESGQMAAIPWLAVYVGEEMVSRIPATAVIGVHYD